MIDFQGLFRSGICSWLAGDKGNRFGFDEARELSPHFYDARVKVDNDAHAVDKNIALLNHMMGWNESYEAPRFEHSPETAEAVKALMAEQELKEPLIAIAPCSRWESKSWPAGFFAETIDDIARRHKDVSFWLLGSDEESEKGEKVKALCQQPVQNLMGKTSLEVLLALIQKSRLMITNDSGPMHLAAAVETPTCALFGPTSAGKTGPYGNIHQIFQSQVDCSPCFKRVCPLPKQICLNDISSGQIADAATAILAPGDR